MERKDVYKIIEDHYKLQFSTLVKRIRNAVGGHHNAEDTVQEAYTRALRYWNTYDPGQPFERWIGTILANCIRDTQKESLLYGMVQEEASPLVDAAPAGADDVVASNEVIKTIDKQPLHMRLILRASLIWGYTSEEISQFTNYKPDAIRKAVSRFRQGYAHS